MRLRSRQVSWKMGVRPCVLEDLAGGKTAQTHDGRLVIGDVDIVNAGEIFLRLFYQAVDMNSLGGPISAETTNSLF